MICLSTPAAPSLARTLSQAASRVAAANTLSIKLYQRPPLTPLTSADTIRSVHTQASIQLLCVSLRTSPPCVAPAGTFGVVCAFVSVIAHPPSYPPSLGMVLLPTLFAAYTTQHARRGIGTMRALNPAAPRQCDRPLRSICLAFRASNPQPADSDEGGQLFRLKPDSVPIDCGQH